jgi:ribonuclease HI
MKKEKIVIFCDGSCSGNQLSKNRGGWGAILRYGSKEKEISGGEANTTNQRMELTACIKALEQIKVADIDIEIYSDSAYIVNCMQQKWYVKWRQNGWKTAHKEPVVNKDLWVKLLNLVEKYGVKFIKVKGHSGNELNERADRLARKGINSILGILFPIILGLSFFSFNSCSRPVDTSKHFAMLHNGREYKVLLDKPIASLRERESGLTGMSTFYIIFPIKKLNPMKNQGFELSFDAASIKIGQEMVSKAGDKKFNLRLRYYPLMGHNFNEGQMLTYSSGYGEGNLKVRFDILETRMGGRVKGIILHSTLFGFYESHENLTTFKPKHPKKLEIFNFPFDTVFGSSLY